MKKALIILAILSASFSVHGQLAYEDFRNNQEFTYYGTVYRLYNPSYHLSEKMREKGKYVRLKSVANEKFEHLAVYTDGSTAQDLDEIQNVVKYAPNDRFILYHAMRNVFSLEELNENSKAIIFFNMVIDNQGIILETSVGFPIKGSYVIQPQQIAALETMIRKNLTFVLDQEKAAKFNYFQGEVWLRFGDFIEEPPSLPHNTGYFIAGQEEERTKPLYTINLVEEFSGPTIIRSDGAPVYDRTGGTLLP